jgi:hypothetical protein
MKLDIRMFYTGRPPCNREVAFDMMLAFEDIGQIPAPSSGWVGEDSDYPRRYWRIGGNHVVVERSYGLEDMRWHDFLRETQDLKYPAV